MSTSSDARGAEAGGPQLSPELLRQAELPTARRGYSKDEADALLASAADALEAMARERGRLQKELEAARAAGSEDEGLRDERDARPSWRRESQSSSASSARPARSATRPRRRWRKPRTPRRSRTT